MKRPPAATEDRLDATQYSSTSIALYESVYGEDFVSPGGREMAVELIESLQLEHGSRVLDVGCGLGGSAFVMARDFGLEVHGIDLSKNMLVRAQAKLDAYRLAGQVTLEHMDCLTLERPEHYDAVYSREVFLHIAEKARLFSVLYQALKPGARLLFTDYCCGQKPWTDAFSTYVRARGYSLCTVSQYADLVRDAGFRQVSARDLTERFMEILEADAKAISVLDIEEALRADLHQSWRGKLARTRSGDHRWGLVTAVK